MSFAQRDLRRRETLQALARVDPWSYARARLGTLSDDPVVKEAVMSRVRDGWEPLAAIDEAMHRSYRRMFDLVYLRNA